MQIINFPLEVSGGFENSHDKEATVEEALWQKRSIVPRPMEKSKRAAEETMRTTMLIQKRWWGRLIFASLLYIRCMYI